MKYSVFGYNQQVACDLGLDVIDLLIIEWFQEFLNNDSVIKQVVNNNIYCWILFDYLLSDLPILGFNREALRTRFQKLIDASIFEHCISNRIEKR